MNLDEIADVIRERFVTDWLFPAFFDGVRLEETSVARAVRLSRAVARERIRFLGAMRKVWAEDQ